MKAKKLIPFGVMSQRRGRKTEWWEEIDLIRLGRKKTHRKRQYLRCKYLSFQYLFYRYKNRTRKVVFAIRIKNNNPLSLLLRINRPRFYFQIYIWHAQRLPPFTDRLKSDFFPPLRFSEFYKLTGNEIQNRSPTSLSVVLYSFAVPSNSFRNNFGTSTYLSTIYFKRVKCVDCVSKYENEKTGPCYYTSTVQHDLVLC